MSWFKHNGNASFDTRIIALHEALGYFGIGIYWTMVERIECWGEGYYPRKRLIEEMASRKADRHKLQMVLDFSYTIDVDIFRVENNDLSLLNDSVKKRLLYYNKYYYDGLNNNRLCHNKWLIFDEK